MESIFEVEQERLWVPNGPHVLAPSADPPFGVPLAFTNMLVFTLQMYELERRPGPWASNNLPESKAGVTTNSRQQQVERVGLSARARDGWRHGQHG